jgi:copper(I)-binding protein
MSRKQWLYWVLATLSFACQSSSWAHGFKAEKIQLDHPYAVELASQPGHFAIYFRTFKNTGTTTDVLRSAQTSVAKSVVFRTETHSVDHEITWVGIKSISVAPGQSIAFRHDDEQGYQLLLQDLTKPLKNGDRFTLTLNFEHAGKAEVTVWVQQPRNAMKSHQH